MSPTLKRYRARPGPTLTFLNSNHGGEKGRDRTQRVSALRCQRYRGTPASHPTKAVAKQWQKQPKKSVSLEEPPEITLNTNFVEDKQRSRSLRRRVDLRLLPLCAFIYLLNYLDRGNIGASKIMNEETKDDILDVTNTTTK